MTEAKIEIRDSDNENSYIRFGEIARADKDTELHVYHHDNPREPTRVLREFVAGTKKKCLDDLIAEQPYIVVVIGNLTAGVATTAGHSLIAPFDLFIDPPEDHSKDFMTIPIPANRPVSGELERMIKAMIK